MTDTLAIGQPPIPVTLRRSARARRLSLRVSTLDGRVTLTVPPRTAARTARAFAESKEAWLRAQLTHIAPPVIVGPGTVLTVLDRPVTLADGPRLRLDGATLYVTSPKQAQAWVKEQARAALAAASDRYAAQLGRRYARLTLRDTRSRWGSCTSDRRLMFSWRLALAPLPVLDYVAAHEVAHLEHMDHSPAFWRVVERLCPDWRTHRDWLRRHGASLHAIRFDT